MTKNTAYLKNAKSFGPASEHHKEPSLTSPMSSGVILGQCHPRPSVVTMDILPANAPWPTRLYLLNAN
jgi:hypothetical protein